MTLPAEAAGSAPGRGRLAGRRVLVVGAGTRPSPEPDPPIGNGRAISVLAAREGAAVACADRDAGAAEATAVVLADVASPQECASVVAESAAALGGLDGLVLNVGIGLGRGMTGTTVAQWDQTFAVNTRAHFLVAAAALTVLDPGSAIVFVSSAASLRAATGIPAYDASKAGGDDPRNPGQPRSPEPGGHPARTRGVAAQPGSHRAEPAVRQAGHRLGSGLRHGMAAVRRI
jgi:hypothetical protein